jgi:ATP dependent DNA ligase domain
MSRTSTLPKRLQPMLATLTEASFDDPGWVFEDKYDGFRMIAEIRRGKVSLYSRNGKIISRSYIEVARPTRMSASLIGRLGSSTFRLCSTAVSMSLTGSCFSSESAPGPFQYGIRRRGGTI